MGAREDQLARITQLERIKTLEAKSDASGNGLGDPGAQAAGVTDGPTPAAEAKAQPLSKKLEATLAGYGQGATMGYMPQINAVTEMGIEKAMHLKDKLAKMAGVDSMVSDDQKLRDQGFQLPEDSSYVQKRDSYDKREKQLSHDNPYLYGAGQVGGTAATALMLPGGAASKTATTMQKIISGMRTGAVLGAAQNPGDVEGVVDPLQAKQRVEGAGMGMAFGALPEATIAGLKKAAPYLKKLAAREAFAALGPYARAAKQAVGRGEVEKIGQTMIDEGVTGGAQLPTGYEGLKKRAASAAQKRGAELEGYMGDLAEKEAKLTGADTPGIVPQGEVPGMTRAGVSRKSIADATREEMISPHTDLPGVAEANKEIEKLLMRFEQGDDSVIPVLEAWEKKQKIGDLVNWDRPHGADIPLPEQVNRKLYGKLNQGIKDEATFIEQQAHPNLLPGQSDVTAAGKFDNLNEKFSLLKKGEGIAQMRGAHELAKKAMLPGIGAAYGLTQGGEKGDLGERIKHAIQYGAMGWAANKGLQLAPQVTVPLLRMGSGTADVLGKVGAAGLKKVGNKYVVPAVSNRLLSEEIKN